MKGLILKDIYGVKFQIFGALLIMLLPIAIMVFGERGSAIGGGTDILPGVAIIPNVLLNYVVMTTCSSFLLNTLRFDEQSGWSKMQLTMPLTSGKIIGAKLASMGLVLSALTLIFLVVNIIGIFVHGLPPEPTIASPFCLCMVQTLALAPTFVLGYRFGARVTSAAYICITVLLAAVMIWLAFMIFGGNIGGTALRIICYAVLPVLTAAVVAASRVTGKKTVTAVDI